MKANFSKVNFPPQGICKLRKIGDGNLNMYWHNALEITKPFHIPYLFEFYDQNEAIRA